MRGRIATCYRPPAVLQTFRPSLGSIGRNTPLSPTSLPLLTHQQRYTSVHRVPRDEQLAFALITPKSLAKSLTGGIIARLLATPGLKLVGARMLQPSSALTGELHKEFQRAALQDGVLDPYETTFLQSFRQIFGQEELMDNGIANHVMVLLFGGGPHTRRLLSEVVGTNVPAPNDFGKTIRGTYGDYFRDRFGKISIFQPAVVIPQTDKSNRRCLELLANFFDSDHALRTIEAEERSNPIGWAKHTGLVVIKPDNLQRPSSLPGHIIDMLGTTGLQLVGARVFSMSVRRGMEFYGFLENVFVKKLRPGLESTLKHSLSEALEFPVSEQEYSRMADLLIQKQARAEVAKVVHFMSGVHPDHVKTEAEYRQPGPAKCFALLYRGDKAIDIIRSKLGVADPKKAQAGTIRCDYGHDLMRNGAHASDSPETALRERRIVGMMGDEPSEEKAVVLEWLQASAPFCRC